MNIAVEPPYDYKVGGSLPPNDPTYIERKADHELYQAVSKGEFCYVLNARQMVKSSLMIRTLKRLEKDDFRCVFIDISLIGDRNSSSEEWYFGLIERLNTVFQINDIYSWWNDHQDLSPIDRFKIFIEDFIIKKEKEKIIFFFDEIDSIIKFDFKDDFFTLIRGFYEARSYDSKHNRLTFIISGVASPSDLMSKNTQTPFNIGKAIELKGFTLQETIPLWEGLKHKVDDPEEVMKEILEWTGGQPFLTQKICQLIQQDSNRIYSQAEKHYINYLIQWKIIEYWGSQDNPQHLRTIHERLKDIHRKYSFFGQYQSEAILNGLSEYLVDEDWELELRLSGFMLKEKGKLKVYNPIYKKVFKNVLNEFNKEKQIYSLTFLFSLIIIQNIIQRLTKKPLVKILESITIIIGLCTIIGTPLYLIFENVQSRTPTTSTPSPTNPNVTDIPLQQRFSSGDKRLFTNQVNPHADKGIEAFDAGNYDEAYKNFTQAVKTVRNDPEVQIYLNNSQARKRGKPFILAAVVPVDTKRTNAEEMLRGVAQAQTQFNQQGVNGRLVEIVIFNDSNDKKYAQQVAQKIVNNADILGVIGHNSSGASAEGLKAYEAAGIAMISPTSTSTSLSRNVFFKTVPSDAKTGKFLAEYAVRNNMIKVAVFYTSTSNYSKSLKKAFVDEFQLLGTTTVLDMSLPNFNPPKTVEALQNIVDAFVLFPNTNNKNINLSLQVADANASLSKPKKLLGGDVLYNPATLKYSQGGVNGLVLAVPWFAKPTYSYTNLAAERWRGRVSWRTATSYDATKAFTKALSGNATRNSVLINLQQTNLPSSETSGESLQFFKSGDRNTNPVLIRVIRKRSNPDEYDFQIIKEN